MRARAGPAAQRIFTQAATFAQRDVAPAVGTIAREFVATAVPIAVSVTRAGVTALAKSMGGADASEPQQELPPPQPPHGRMREKQRGPAPAEADDERPETQTRCGARFTS